MIDELQQLKPPWRQIGPHFAPSAQPTTNERLLSLEITQGHHGAQLSQLGDEVTRLRDAAIAKTQAEATAEKVRAEIREARKNAVSVVALMISAAMLAIALTRFAVDSRPPGGPVSATTVRGPG